MTTAKQAPLAWRKRVDMKLNTLTKGHEELTARLDTYQLKMTENTTITKGIDTKIDNLILQTAVAVELAAKAKWTAMSIRWFWASVQKLIVWITQFGKAAVLVLMFYYVFKLGGDWTQNLWVILKGNLP